MPAPISIVIPTLNAEAELPAALASLIEGLKAGLVRELVVVDGGSTDRTGEIAEAAGARMIASAPSRGGQLRAGAEAARGDWLLFHHADTHLSPGWSEAVKPALADPSRARYFHLGFRARGAAPSLVAAWANARARRFGLPYGDQSLLIARPLYARVGGYPDIPLMEDVALARRLKGQLTRLPATALTSAARYQSEGWMRRGAGNLWTLTRYLAGADPHRLAARYFRP